MADGRLTPHGPTAVELSVDPHPAWDSLRRNGPIAWVDAVGGWVTLTRDLAVTVMRDAATFTVDDPRFSTARVVGPSMLSLDGDAHHRHREPFAHGLRPSDIATAHADWMATAAAELVRSAASPCELRTSLAGPWSVAVMGRVLGVDLPADRLLGWYRAIVAGVEAATAGRPIAAATAEAVAELAATVGRPSFVGPSDLTAAELAADVAVFLFGGIETTEAMIANAVWFLATTPGAWAAVVHDPVRLGAAVEESLRLEPAATRVDRYATRDVALAGVTIVRGDLVVVSLAAAGRDPSVFVDPHRFDLDRPNLHRHLAFATGPHTCVGLNLARAETITLLGALVAAHPDLVLDAALSTPPAGLVFRKADRLIARWA